MRTNIYSFKVESLEGDLNKKEKREIFLRECYRLIDILREEVQPLPLMAPLPDKEIRVTFEDSLPDSILERLAKEGYRCEQYKLSRDYERAA